jgi:formamidopyrimidine-DNA glycosylase
MPELPDVEYFKTYIDATSLHQTLEQVQVHSAKVLEKISGKRLNRDLKNKAFTGSIRHGKYLFLRAENAPLLVLHFGMTGYPEYFRNDGARDGSHDRIVFEFSSGYRLVYVNRRLLGTVTLAQDRGSFIREHDLGPDALDTDRKTFTEIFSSTRSMLKSALMNQHFLAGVGNVYSDEILFQARLHPKMTASDLSQKEMDRLHHTLVDVLEQACGIQKGTGEFPDSWIIPRRSPGSECPSCKGAVERMTVSGRTGYWCPDCQKEEQ